MPARNLLMISVDDLRPVDNWGHFSDLVRTPNLDALSAAGTTFERAVSQVPLCNPSRSSLMSGQQPSTTGILDNDTPWYERIDPAATLPAQMRDAGAYVALFGKLFHEDPIPLDIQRVVADEFLFPATDGSAAQVIRDELRHTQPFHSGRYGGSPANLRDEQTVAAAIDFLENRAGDLADPFFLGVGITRPHLEWWVPSAYYALYDPAEIRAALELSLADGSIIPGNGEYFDVPPMSRPASVHNQIAANMDLWVDYIHAYMAAVTYADAKIGQVLNALRADPALAADTAIMLWSDNGFSLGDHDRWQKFTHWREAAQTPLIIVDPDAPSGQVAPQVVSLVDIFPTAFGLMGLQPQAGLGLQGRSLMPLVNNADQTWYDPETGRGVGLTVVYGEVSVRAFIPGIGDLRYTRYPDGTEELYDLTRDPGEHVNRVNFRNGNGLTARDDQIHATMSALMDDRLADARIFIGDGSGAVVGTGQDDMLVSANRAVSNVLRGGGGDDTYVVYRPSTIVEADNGGFDTVVLRNSGMEASYQLPDNIEAIQVQKFFTGNAADNWISASGNGGRLFGQGGDDRIFAGLGAFTVDGGAGNDLVTGNNGRDFSLRRRGQRHGLRGPQRRRHRRRPRRRPAARARGQRHADRRRRRRCPEWRPGQRRLRLLRRLAFAGGHTRPDLRLRQARQRGGRPPRFLRDRREHRSARRPGLHHRALRDAPRPRNRGPDGGARQHRLRSRVRVPPDHPRRRLDRLPVHGGRCHPLNAGSGGPRGPCARPFAPGREMPSPLSRRWCRRRARANG